MDMVFDNRYDGGGYIYISIASIPLLKQMLDRVRGGG